MDEKASPFEKLKVTMEIVYVILYEGIHRNPHMNTREKLDDEHHCLEALLGMGIDLPRLGDLLVQWSETEEFHALPPPKKRYMPSPTTLAAIFDTPAYRIPRLIGHAHDARQSLLALHGIGCIIQDIAFYLPPVDMSDDEKSVNLSDQPPSPPSSSTKEGA